MEDKIIFETERINFVKLNEKYINDYLDTVNDLETQKFITHNIKTYTFEEEMNWVKTKLEENALIFTMLEKATGDFIGNIELKDVTEVTAELGICLNKKKQDKHFGQEAIKGIIDYAFNVLGLTEMTLNVFNFNPRAQHCYEKVGFVAVGPGNCDDDTRMIYKK